MLLSVEVEAASMLIASDIHPINNLKVGNHLKYMGHIKRNNYLDELLDVARFKGIQQIGF